MNAGALAPFLALRRAAVADAPADPGFGLAHALSDTLDAALAPLLPAGRDDVALVAIGGYGRRELCLFSDIDLMLLCRDDPPAGLVDAVFYPLWDAGLKVGHAVRTPQQAFAAATDRLETLTALLDARHVAGSLALVEELQRRIHNRAVRRRADIAARLAADERAVRDAAPYQLLETDLKTGRGGLRSGQRLHWLRRIGVLVAAEKPGERQATDVLLASRNALHASAGKAHDTWLQELAPSAAAWLHSKADAAATQLYLALREIDRAADAVLQPPEPTRPSGLRAQAAGVVRRQRQRTSEQPAPDVRSVFGYAAALARTGATRLPAAGEAAVSAAQGASWTAADRAGLLGLLRSGDPGGGLLDELARCGWLERTLPEWRHTRGLRQNSPFHLHPLDVHLRRTVAEVVALADGRGETASYAGVAGQLGSLDEVLLAALLHDLGKGWPGDHAETGATAAAAIIRRAGFDPDVRHTVALAIRHHLLLPTVATRRDLSDSRVVEAVADSVGRVRALRVLYLLSVADSRASGPAVWGPWKAALLHDLFARAQDMLIAREAASPASVPAADTVERMLAEAEQRGERTFAVRHLADMPPGYARAFGPRDLLRHVALMRDRGAGGVRWDVRSAGDAYDLALALPDRPGLIASVAGVLALHNLSVLEARFFTRADGVALQTYQLVDAREVDTTPERWQRAAADLDRALSGDLPLEQRLDEKAHAYRRRGRSRPAEVTVDRDAAAPLTVLEVHAVDRVGLLSTIARTLYACGMDVQFAKIDTQGHEVIDAFYVRELSGAPLRDPDRIRAVRATLLAAIDD